MIKIFEDPGANFQDPSAQDLEDSWPRFLRILIKIPLKEFHQGLIQPLPDFHVNHYFMFTGSLKGNAMLQYI